MFYSFSYIDNNIEFKGEFLKVFLLLKPEYLFIIGDSLFNEFLSLYHKPPVLRGQLSGNGLDGYLWSFSPPDPSSKSPKGYFLALQEALGHAAEYLSRRRLSFLFCPFLSLTGVVLSGRQAEPAGKVFFSGPTLQIGARFAEYLKPGVVGKTWQDGGIPSSEQVQHVLPQIRNSRFMVADGLSGSGLMAGLVPVDPTENLSEDGIAFSYLPLVEHVTIMCLFQREESLFGIKTLQGRKDFLGFVFDQAVVTQRKQDFSIPFTAQNGTDDGHSACSLYLAEHFRKSDVHFYQGLLHMVDMHRRATDMVFTQALVPPEFLEFPLGYKTAVQQAVTVQLLYPLAVLHIGLASRYLAGLPSVHQPDVQPSFHEHVVQDDPVRTGRFHRHGLHAIGQKVCQRTPEFGSVGSENLYFGPFQAYVDIAGAYVYARSIVVDLFHSIYSLMNILLCPQGQGNGQATMRTINDDVPNSFTISCGTILADRQNALYRKRPYCIRNTLKLANKLSFSSFIFEKMLTSRDDVNKMSF